MDNDKDLRRVWFPRWAEVLGNSALEGGVKTSHLRLVDFRISSEGNAAAQPSQAR